MSDAAQLAKEKTNAKKKYSRPWEPARRLDVKLRPGFRLKWISKEKLEKSLQEDWEIHRDKHPELARLANEDAKALGNTTELPDLILCEMPEERAQERDAYFRRRIRTASRKPVEEFKKEIRAQGGEAIGTSGIEDT